MEAQLSQPAAAPDPVTGDRINNCRNNHGIDAVRGELGSLCHCTGNDGCSGCTEYGLKDQRRIVQTGGEYINAADQCAGTAEHQACAEQPENRGAQAEVHEVFHNNIACILCTGEARLDHAEACLHEEYKCCAQQRPRGINRGCQVGNGSSNSIYVHCECLLFSLFAKAQIKSFNNSFVKRRNMRCSDTGCDTGCRNDFIAIVYPSDCMRLRCS